MRRHPKTNPKRQHKSLRFSSSPEIIQELGGGLTKFGAKSRNKFLFQITCLAQWIVNFMEGVKSDRETLKSDEIEVCQKLVMLETALSREDSEMLHEIFGRNATFLSKLEESMLSQEFPEEYFDLTQKVFKTLSSKLSLSQEHVELTVFRLQIALIFLKLELNQPKWYDNRRQVGITFSVVIDDLLSNATTITRILAREKVSQEQQFCKLCESAADISQIDQLVYISLIQLYEVLNQAASSAFLPPSVYQKILHFSYFGLETKKQSIASVARTLIAFIFEILPSSQTEIMWRTVYFLFETTEMLQFVQTFRCEPASGRIKEEVTYLLRLLNISGCYACNIQDKSHQNELKHGCRLHRVKSVIGKEATDDSCYTALVTKCDVLVSYLNELMKNALCSSKKRAILNFVESVLNLFPDLLFPSAFFVVATLFQWCLEVLRNYTENSNMRQTAVEMITKIAIRLLEIQKEHRSCKKCLLIAERGRAVVLFDSNTFHLEQLAPHSLGCWMTVLNRVAKKVNVVFEETIRNEALNLSNASQLSIKEVVECSAASCSLTKTGPCQTVEALFSILSIASQQERQKVIQSIKYILRTDPKFFVELRWVENALLLLSRDPAASVRAASMELGLQFTNVHQLSERKIDLSTSMDHWADIVLERLRDSNTSVRKAAMYFAKMLLIFFATTNSASGNLMLRKKLFKQVISRLEDDDVAVQETCMECLEDYFQCAQRKLHVQCGSSYELVQFYHEIFESLNILKSSNSRKLLFQVASKVNFIGASLMENLTKCAMSIVAKTFQKMCDSSDRSSGHVDEHYHLATLFLETACEWEPEYTAPYERYLLSCIELSLKPIDFEVHVVSNIICLLSSLYESTPAGLEGAKKFFRYLELILTSNLCPVLGNAVMKSLRRLCKIPAFRVEVEELLHELVNVAKNQTCQWQATPDGSDAQENTWKIISTIFARIASLSSCVSSKSIRESTRRALLWFFSKIFDFLRQRLQSGICFDEAWFPIAMEAALIYSKCDSSYMSSLRESVVLLLQSNIVGENQKLSLLFNLQTMFSEGIRELQSSLNESVGYDARNNVELFCEMDYSLVDSISILVQQLLNVFLDLVFFRNILIRKHVCNIICQCVFSGVVVPVEVLPSLFCFVLDDESQPDIRERAMSTLKFIAQSQQDMIGTRLVEGLHNAWKFWNLTLNSDWNSLVDRGSGHCLHSRFGRVLCLLSSSQLFGFIRAILDEITSNDESWQFYVFCTVPLLFLEPSCILALKGQRRRSSNVLEEMKLTTEKCMQLLATADFEVSQDTDAVENCTRDCLNAIRLYLILLVHDKFQFLIQSWSKIDEVEESVFTMKNREYWDELTTFGSHASHLRIRSRISALMGNGDGFWNNIAIDLEPSNSDKENFCVFSHEMKGQCFEAKKKHANLFSNH